MKNLEDKVLVCRNLKCGRESCVLLESQTSSLCPLRREDLEKGEEARKKIDDKLSEAMLKEYLKCGYKFHF